MKDYTMVKTNEWNRMKALAEASGHPDDLGVRVP